MASTYVNNLRLEEMATGEQSGTWGTKTNTNLELIGQAVAWGTRAIANASTDNITIADGAADADRCLGLKLTGGGQACTVTLLPNTSSKTWVMYNATSYTLTFTCGSGANVAILAGETKMIATDGLGSGGVVHDLLTSVNLAGTTKTAALTNAGVLTQGGILSVDDTTTSTSGTTGSIHTDGGLGVAGTSTLIGVTTHGDDVVSDTDSVDDLGTTGVRWANLFVDAITATDQVTATGFTGTLDGILGSGTPAAATVTTLNASDQVVVSGSGNRSMSITSTDGIASMEIGAAASNAAFIDFKTPSGDDFDLRISSESGGAGGNITINGGTFSIVGTAETMATFADDGAVTLYHNNVARIATTANGTISTGDIFTLYDTSTDAAYGPYLDLNRDSASPADNDGMGVIRFLGDNDAGEGTPYAGIYSINLDMTDGTEDGGLDINTIVAGTVRSRLYFYSNQSIFNEAAQDIDFRVESSNNANMIYVDASGDAVGIGTPPNVTIAGNSLEVNAGALGTTATNMASAQLLSASSGNFVTLQSFAYRTSNGSDHTTAEWRTQRVVDATRQSYVGYGSTYLSFGTTATEQMRMDSAGTLIIGATSTNATASLIELRTAANTANVFYMLKASQVEMCLGFKTSTDSNFYVGTGSTSVGTNGVYLSNTATSWTSNSDFRKKKNLSPIENALDKIANCRAVTGHYKHEADDVKKRPFLIAQDWVTALPEAVDQDTVDDDGVENLGLSYEGTIPLLVAAIKELREQNIALTNRITALEG
tara:strand:+ start:1384 stop:3687 length:2304 start_codon:yes stop_codon:yes gene_type:complete